jgi:uncharacterized protein (TIGR01777 family)
MPKTVLITGASGLVGSRLTEILLDSGYQVSHLGRQRTSKKQVKSYIWNIPHGFIEKGALENTNIVVHLAGAGVADKRWTKKRKEEILQSRVQSTKLLFRKLSATTSVCEAFISASAIGYYGLNTGDTWLNEEDPSGDGFLSEVTKKWEYEIMRLKELKLRVAALRTGIVLSNGGGALPKIAATVRVNLGAVLGSGKQFMSWIHIDDLCQIIIAVMNNPGLEGIFNAVAPVPVTNKDFTRTLARVMGKPLWLPAVPGWVLTIMLGEMAQLVLGGNRVSANKIRSSTYDFKFAELQPALEEVLLGKDQGI